MSSKEEDYSANGMPRLRKSQAMDNVEQAAILSCLFSLLALVQSHSLRDEEVQPRLQKVIDK